MTTKDLFGSIPKPIDVDPFEGIDMEAINVLRRPVEKDEEGVLFDEFNRMGGFDISDISGSNVDPVKVPPVEDLISLNGVDTKYISVKRPYPSPKEETRTEEKNSENPKIFRFNLIRRSASPNEAESRNQKATQCLRRKAQIKTICP